PVGVAARSVCQNRRTPSRALKKPSSVSGKNSPPRRAGKDHGGPLQSRRESLQFLLDFGPYLAVLAVGPIGRIDSRLDGGRPCGARPSRADHREGAVEGGESFLLAAGSEERIAEVAEDDRILRREAVGALQLREPFGGTAQLQQAIPVGVGDGAVVRAQ